MYLISKFVIHKIFYIMPTRVKFKGASVSPPYQIKKSVNVIYRKKGNEKK